MLIPGTQLLVTGDKRGVGFLVDKNQLGGIAPQDSQIVQRFQGTTRGMFGGAAFYKHGAGGSYFLWGTGDRLKQCGTTKGDCFQGLVSAGLVTPAHGNGSPIGIVGQSPLVWLGGGMPLDSAAPNAAAGAAVQAWVAAGALDN